MLPRIFQPDEDPVDDSPFTVAAVIDLYLRHSRATGLHCPEALADRIKTLDLFVESCGDLRIEDCKPFHLSDFIESHTGWRALSTRRAKANAVKAAFQWALDGERINKNPFMKVHYGESARRPELPDATLDELCKLANKPFDRACRFLRLTGCRLSEMCRARWGDFDLDRGIWTIDKHKSLRHTLKPKLVALVAETIGILCETKAAAKKTLTADDVVFVNTRGTAWTRRTLGQQFDRMKKRHGIECKASLGGARHAAASNAIRNGAPLKFVSLMLGHASTAITEKNYLHCDDDIERIREAVNLSLPKTLREPQAPEAYSLLPPLPDL